MTYTAVDSSMIDLVGYDEKARILEVRFLNSGLSYSYFDVPKKVYKGLLKAPSKGIFMNEWIIGVYDYVRVKARKRREGK
ncbi:MAG: KTSC domain-containing protein [Saprospiraceae bacterium]|nr:KTSC domain-containing protein [Saprospiraceae bacterium]